MEAFESSMRKWGEYSRLVDFNRSTKELVVKVDVERLTAEYVMRLLKAFQADLKARLFIIDMLGPETFAYLDGLGVGIDDLTSALLEYETDSKVPPQRQQGLLSLCCGSFASRRKSTLQVQMASLR
jgi:hypothetical protein